MYNNKIYLATTTIVEEIKEKIDDKKINNLKATRRLSFLNRHPDGEDDDALDWIIDKVVDYLPNISLSLITGYATGYFFYYL